MFKGFEFCLPTMGTKVPAGPEWLHEIKYDGFHLRVERDGDRVRLFTPGGAMNTVELGRANRSDRDVL